MVIGATDEEPVRPSRPRSRPKMKRLGTNTAAPRKSNAVIQMPCNVRTFSETIGVPCAQVLGKLLGLGTMANINTELMPS